MAIEKRVVIVEDETDFMEMVKIRLELNGYFVDMATDALSGARKIIETIPDLVILDLMMPAGGGFRVLELIRKNRATEKTPVLIITGKKLEEEDKMKALSYGVTTIFLKPYNAEKFIEKVQMLTPLRPV
jgi:DNA-binding response OmpR family regulator